MRKSVVIRLKGLLTKINSNRLNSNYRYLYNTCMNGYKNEFTRTIDTMVKLFIFFYIYVRLDEITCENKKVLKVLLQQLHDRSRATFSGSSSQSGLGLSCQKSWHYENSSIRASSTQ